MDGTCKKSGLGPGRSDSLSSGQSQANAKENRGGNHRDNWRVIGLSGRSRETFQKLTTREIFANIFHTASGWTVAAILTAAVILGAINHNRDAERLRAQIRERDTTIDELQRGETLFKETLKWTAKK